MTDRSPHLSLEDLIRGRGAPGWDEQHVAGCPECQAEVLRWERVSGAVASYVSTAAPPPEMSDEVLASIDRSPSPTHGRRRRRRELAGAGTGSGRATSSGAIAAVGLGVLCLTFALLPSTAGAAGPKLLDRQVRMPMGFTAVAESGPPCLMWATSISLPVPTDAAWAGPTTATKTIGNLVSGPRGRHGCIQSGETGPYSLPAGVSATSPLLSNVAGATPTTVDGYYAESAPITVHVGPPILLPPFGAAWVCYRRAGTASVSAGGSSGSSGANAVSGPSGSSGASGVSGPSGSSGTSGSYTLPQPVCASGAVHVVLPARLRARLKAIAGGHVSWQCVVNAPAPSGTSGTSGSSGASGASGVSGPSGGSGSSGASGSSGQNWVARASGASGLPIPPPCAGGPPSMLKGKVRAGVQVLAGSPGWQCQVNVAAAPSGSSGTSGTSGSSGPSGSSGASGSSGTSGPSGSSGASGASGPSGSSGPSGASGTSGSTVPTQILCPSGPVRLWVAGGARFMPAFVCARAQAIANGTSGTSGHATRTVVVPAVKKGSATKVPRCAMVRPRALKGQEFIAKPPAGRGSIVLGPRTAMRVGPALKGTVVFIRVPTSGGQYRLVTVTGWGMPASEIIKLAAQALAHTAS